MKVKFLSNRCTHGLELGLSTMCSSNIEHLIKLCFALFLYDVIQVLSSPVMIM